MPMPSIHDASTAAESWAEVRVRDQIMRYRRSGVGPAVLLLHSPDEPESLWPEQLGALGAGFRLIVPEPPAADRDVARWVADFLEGLGVSNIGILATERFCIPALELALRQPDQIAGLVLVPEGRGTEQPGVSGALETATLRSPVPLIVVRRGELAEAILPVVKAFLRGEGIAAVA